MIGDGDIRTSPATGPPTRRGPPERFPIGSLVTLPVPIGLHYPGAVLEIAFRPDRSSDVPMARQLADHLETLVRSGRLVGGSKLPASREAALALGVSRKTVVAASDPLPAPCLPPSP